MSSNVSNPIDAVVAEEPKAASLLTVPKITHVCHKWYLCSLRLSSAMYLANYHYEESPPVESVLAGHRLLRDFGGSICHWCYRYFAQDLHNILLYS